MRRRRRKINLIALIGLMMLLGFANYAAHWIGGTVLPVFIGLASMIVLYNFTWYKFK